MRKRRIIQAGIVFLGCLILCLYAGKKEDREADVMSPGKRPELIWYSDQALWKPPGLSEQQGSSAERIAEHTGTKISYMVPEDNGDVRLSLMMINNNMPDIISISDRKLMQHLIDSGEVWKIDELMEAYLPESHLLSDYPADVKEQLIRRDGGWYGLISNLHSEDNRRRYEAPLPCWAEMQQKKSDYGIIWNKALLKRLELSENGLYKEEDVREAFETARKREATFNGKPVIPLLVDGSRYQKTTLQTLLAFWGAVYPDENGNSRENIFTRESGAALSFLNDAFINGYADAEQIMMTPYQVGRVLNSGQVLCFIGDIANAGIDPEQWVSSGVILPASGENPVLSAENREVRETMTFISKSCEYPEAAARWLDYMTDEEGMRAYLEDCEDEWWPLRDDDWYYSVQGEPDSQDEAWMQLLCAFARAPESRVCERETAPEAWQGTDAEAEIRQRKSEGLNSLIMAETKEAFWQEYENLQEELKAADSRRTSG